MSEGLVAETVKLKNGSVLKGVIVEMNQTDLVIDTAEMGRVTVKRYTIQNISDDASTGSTGTVINVNNSNQVEQKNEQTNSQVNTQTMQGGKDQEEPRRWRQGLQGRFLISQESARFKQKSETLDFPKNYSGLDWDLIGFRSESWWAVYLNLVTQSVTRDSVDYSLSGTSIRLDWNAFKNVNGDTLSLVYFGIAVGTGYLETETTDTAGRKLSYELSGTRTSLRLGYDYFWGQYWGLSAFASISGTALEGATYKIDGVAATDTVAQEEISVNASSFGLGLLYNFDL
ncbi:hypothetical protein [Oligoflexus tunisiensis]|uniref:hypothetical protein n=1 Tax=Oligoflexus tunisiensis TaxID=708132 RepID=UPI001C403C09|nr:hypothetical protein [Oligoflexus tunisiensis]